MPKSIVDLIYNLNEQTTLYSQIFSFEKEKSLAITGENIGLIDAITGQEETLVNRCTALEEARVLILDVLGFEGKTISDIISITDADSAEKLKNSSEELLDIVTKIKIINNVSATLTNIKLDTVDKLIKKAEQKTPPMTYQQDGSINKTSAEGRVIVSKA